MDAEQQITYKNKKLITSDTFFTFDEGPTTVRIDYKDDYLIFIFNVVNNDGDRKNSVTSNVTAHDTIEITIENFHNVVGSSAIGPTLLGSIAGQLVYLLLRVTGAKSKGSKLITYSIYVEEAN